MIVYSQRSTHVNIWMFYFLIENSFLVHVHLQVYAMLYICHTRLLEKLNNYFGYRDINNIHYHLALVSKCKARGSFEFADLSSYE